MQTPFRARGLGKQHKFVRQARTCPFLSSMPVFVCLPPSAPKIVLDHPRCEPALNYLCAAINRFLRTPDLAENSHRVTHSTRAVSENHRAARAGGSPAANFRKPPQRLLPLRSAHTRNAMASSETTETAKRVQPPCTLLDLSQASGHHRKCEIRRTTHLHIS